MRTRWFGEPWGVGGIAPICDPEFRLPDELVPYGVACAAADCGEDIDADERGVVTAYGVGRDAAPTAWERRHVFTLPLRGDAVATCVVYHADCFLAQVVPQARHLIERVPGC